MSAPLMTTQNTDCLDQPPPASDVDLFDMESILEPHACDGAIRELGPVVWMQKHGCYVVGRHASVQALYTDWRNLQNFGSPFNPNSLIPAVIIVDNPPVHSRLRNAIVPLVSPQTFRDYKEGFVKTAKSLVDRALDERELDARALIADFVVTAFPDLLGLPLEGRRHLLNFGEAIINTLGPMNDIARKSMERAGEAFAWVQAECTREKVSPDGLAAKVYALADNGAVSETEAGLLVRTLLAAGFDTTILGITSVLYGLTTNPEQWPLLSDAITQKRAFDEGLRFFPPNRFGGRIVAADTEFEGVQFRKGDMIATLLGACGRDPRHWSAPDTFDVTRDSKSHLSFGYGIHGCLGQVLARFEYSTLMGELVRRVARIEAAGPAERNVSNIAMGWSKLPIRLHPH
jgi:cytochrome P450